MVVVINGVKPSRKHRVGVLALVCKDDDRSCKTLFRNVVKPRLTNNETLDINTRFTGVTWRDYRNGIPYNEAMAQVKSLLKDTIVVGHDIRSDERALCFGLDRVIDTVTNPKLNDLVPSEKGKTKSTLSRSLLISSIPSDSYYSH